jgi:hypothetical protein
MLAEGMLLVVLATGQVQVQVPVPVPVEVPVPVPAIDGRVERALERESTERQLQQQRLQNELAGDQLASDAKHAEITNRLQELEQRLNGLEQRLGSVDITPLWTSMIRRAASGQIVTPPKDGVERVLLEDQADRVGIAVLDARMRLETASAELAMLERLSAKGMASAPQVSRQQLRVQREKRELTRLERLDRGLRKWLFGTESLPASNQKPVKD